MFSPFAYFEYFAVNHPGFLNKKGVGFFEHML